MRLGSRNVAQLRLAHLASTSSLGHQATKPLFEAFEGRGTGVRLRQRMIQIEGGKPVSLSELRRGELQVAEVARGQEEGRFCRRVP